MIQTLYVDMSQQGFFITPAYSHVCICVCIGMISFLSEALLVSLSYSHQTQTTCWDHPKMTELFQSLGECSS